MNLDDALESISRAAGRIENVARARAREPWRRVGDVSGNNATREDVRQALASAATIVKSIDSVTRDVRDFAGANATREDVRQVARVGGDHRDVGSVAGNVSDYARKNATRDDFNDVVRKLGKLIDKGLDQFD